MYLMYVDESGDPGLINSPTRYFILTGLVVHELRWRIYLERLIDFRRRMKAAFGLNLRDEIHAAAMINNPGKLVRIRRNDRLSIIRHFSRELGAMTETSLINVVVDKAEKRDGQDVFEVAWKTLIQRFENTVSHRNFPGPANPDERGMILCDHTADKKLAELMRQMRRFNPIPHMPNFGGGYRNLALNSIIEDPVFRNSAHSYFIQAVDLAAFLLYQRMAPSAYIKRKSGQNYFKSLESILCRVASAKDPEGIVWV